MQERANKGLEFCMMGSGWAWWSVGFGPSTLKSCKRGPVAAHDCDARPAVGASATLAGVIGRDKPGQRLRKLIESHDVEPHPWTDDRLTAWKQRIVTRGHLRPDRCDREVTTPIHDRAAQFLSEVRLGDMLLISDYGKGVCTRSLLQILGDRARHAGVPILVDPARSRNWFGYGQVALIKANWVEATEGARGDHRHPLALARHLVEQYNCHTIVTLGRHGMVAAEREGGAWYLPAEATEVRDVCGAGDTVLAAFGLALSEGRSLHDAGRCALNAASHQVESLGIVAVPFVA